jgi:5'-methylthioadenosine phosphorylase
LLGVRKDELGDDMPKVGIIGGSGLYQIDALKDIKEVAVETPFGNPSDNFIIGNLEGVEVAFLARHKRGHTILPTELNYRANIYAMKKLGVEQLISISAVGSFKKELKPLDIVLPGQFVDRTNQARKTTFFGQGIVAHISFADPVCGELKKIIYDAGRKLRLAIHDKGAYLNMEGPAFSTRAESHLYKSWGMDIIGMTNMPEARLAREAEMCFATIAMVTDYDCWYEEDVNIEMVLGNLFKNVDTAKKLIKEVVPRLSKERKCGCGDALKYAIVTDKKLITESMKERLSIIIGKYL